MHQARHEGDSYRRVELITGARRRRSWSDAEKVRIVAESDEPEANVSEVARRNGVSRGLLTVWRRQARVGAPGKEGFARVEVDCVAEAPFGDGVTGATIAIAGSRVSTLAKQRIEIEIADATVQVPANVDARTLERVLAALRSTR